jgi:hypothetical protein
MPAPFTILFDIRRRTATIGAPSEPEAERYEA